jgi:putative transposase
VDKEGHTIDFLLPLQRARDAAAAFLRTAIRPQGLAVKVTSEQSGANTAAIKRYKRTPKTTIGIRHCKYLNTIVEQDYRGVKRLIPPMLGVKSFWSARCTLAGSAGMHAIRKEQLVTTGTVPQTSAE